MPPRDDFNGYNPYIAPKRTRVTDPNQIPPQRGLRDALRRLARRSLRR